MFLSTSCQLKQVRHFHWEPLPSGRSTRHSWPSSDRQQNPRRWQQVGICKVILDEAHHQRTDNRIGSAEFTLPPGTKGPPAHWHEMHDETFLGRPNQ